MLEPLLAHAVDQLAGGDHPRPATDAPSTDAPAMDVPAMDAPATGAPAAEGGAS